MPQSQVLQNSKIDLLSSKNPSLNGRVPTGAGVAINPTDLVSLQQVKDLITQAGGNFPQTTTTATTNAGTQNTGTPQILSGAPGAVLFYDPTTGQLSQDATNFSYAGSGILDLVGLVLSGLTASEPVLTTSGKALVSGLINLVSMVSGVLPTTNGGTGANTANFASLVTLIQLTLGALIASNNLSDIGNATTARANLGAAASFTGFTGTLAAAVAGGKNVTNGVIQP